MNPVLLKGYISNFCHTLEHDTFSWHFDNLKKRNFVEYNPIGVQERIDFYMLHDRINNFNENLTLEPRESLLFLNEILKTITGWLRLINDIEGVQGCEFMGDIFDSTYIIIENIENCIKFLQYEIEETEKSLNHTPISRDGLNKNSSYRLEWGNKTEISELIYVLFHSQRIKVNGQPIEQKELAKVFSELFNTEIEKPIDLLNKSVKTFKKGEHGKTFLSELNSILDGYIDKVREKENS
jgi:hypothetical protein